jgi:hypothetical protein
VPAWLPARSWLSGTYIARSAGAGVHPLDRQLALKALPLSSIGCRRQLACRASVQSFHPFDPLVLAR